MTLQSIDIAVIAVYAIGLLAVALWVSREHDGASKDASDYFLAGRALPWWAIGASLIAANISAEQIIGMSGSAWAMGIAIGVYEWTAAIALIVVGKFLLPVFLKQKIYTMPQYLEQRFDNRVRNLMAVFWLVVYVFVNLTAILWLGALAVNTVTGVDPSTGMIALAVFAVAYSLYGGLKAVAMTDIIQVVLLIVGGLFIAAISLDRISDGAGIAAGFSTLVSAVPEKFDLIFTKDSEHYNLLPGISVLIGGMWVMHFSYWGFNQYIIQRALAAKSTEEAQKGLLFAAFLKMLMPIIVVLPGVAAVILAPDLPAPDQAYPTMMTLLPAGLLGLVFAALIGAIVSSLASMMNSISTIFTMDLYRHYSAGDASEQHLVKVGRIAAIAAMIVALVLAKPLLGEAEQAFQFIQEFTGFFTPGVCAIFGMGLFWSKTNANGALAMAFGSFLFSLLFRMFLPEIPFIDRVSIVFVLCLLVGVFVSLTKPRQQVGNDIAGVDTSTSAAFNVGSLAVVAMLVALYATWW
ncbi:MAG: sodium/sugar symporter [Pseudomonadota bacterium]